MEELIVEGNRADADQFKQGAFQKPMNKMKEKFSECGLTDHNVTLYTPGKPFLLFECLGNIFAKDRSTGLKACSGKNDVEDVTPGSTIAAVIAGGLGLGGDDVDMEDLVAVESKLPNTFLTSFASSSERNQGR
ncbi:hypothetical protein Ahy_B10g104365 [Arachis hypogaea]|uniref:Uncharacterized protein n=1 Tax=Arachis hypogaea TaxID=3818 RepID=A0A444X5D2_ARAHY|nr:hypothetical protein Ahy_B10g104365 [Arachis hypogaea]